jgi:hypothetical protein
VRLAVERSRTTAASTSSRSSEDATVEMISERTRESGLAADVAIVAW